MGVTYVIHDFINFNCSYLYSLDACNLFVFALFLFN